MTKVKSKLKETTKAKRALENLAETKKRKEQSYRRLLSNKKAQTKARRTSMISRKE